jgi:hypothetical protein
MLRAAPDLVPHHPIPRIGQPHLTSQINGAHAIGDHHLPSHQMTVGPRFCAVPVCMSEERYTPQMAPAI